MSDEYLTLAQAAAQLGYKEYSALRKAAKAERLQTRKFGTIYVTTQAWLDEWLKTVQPKGWPKGKARGPRRPHDQQPPSQETGA